MNSDKLYKVQEQDLDRLKEILTVCFHVRYSGHNDSLVFIFLSAT